MSEEIVAEYIVENEEPIQTEFIINASGTTWGNIEGDIENQTDLKNALDSKADDSEITAIDGRLDTIESTLSGYGNIVTHNVPEFATAEQGALADTALQPGDDITELNNNAGYQTNVIETIQRNGTALTPENKTVNIEVPTTAAEVGALPDTTTINDLTTTAQQNALNSGITSTDVTLIGTALQPNDDISKLNNDAGYIKGITSTDVTNALGYTPYNSTNPNGYITGITSTDVINALGYTPYSSANPNNYSSTLNGLTDVSLTSPTQGQNLTYDAVNQKWINSSTTATVGWGGITGTLSDQTDLQNALNDKQDVIDADNKLSASYISGLGAVATSNDYNDLTNKPTIPSAQVNSDWNANSGVAQILNKPTLSTVATSGNYQDLSNKPTIPTDVSDLTNTTLANVLLSNLDTDGENRLHALKGYTESGQIYSDSQLYNDVYAQYHSTFDLSKFTVVGSPTITDDGIASGFSSSNYITVNLGISNSPTFVYEFTTGTIPSSGSPKFINFIGINTFIYINTSSAILTVRYEDSNSTVKYGNLGEISSNTKYKLIITLSTNNLSITKIVNNTETDYTFNDFSMAYANLTGFDLNNAEMTNGSIDLKQFSITVDGVPVFSGNKTGTDLIITDNYTVVGSPTITDGVMSNIDFRTEYGGYATTQGIFTQNFGDYDTWEIEIPFTFRSSFGNNFDILLFDGTTSDTDRCLAIQLRAPNSQLRIYLVAQDGTNISIGDTSTDTFTAGESLTAKLVFTGTQYILYTKKPNEDWKAQITKNNSKKLKKSNNPVRFGVDWRWNENWGGSINLYGIRFIGNNKLVYACKCQIPYNISDSGNKIADVQYRPDVYYANYLGYKSSYFTIDTTNQNVTLPYKNIYSLINKSLDYNFKLIQGYDGTATQTLKHVNGVLQWVSD